MGMKPQEFIDSSIIRESFGSPGRVVKQLQKARSIKANVYPAGKKGNVADIYASEACKALMLLIYNPNPAQEQEVREATQRIKTMIEKDFVNDFAMILEGDGTTLRGHTVRAVFICVDRAFAKIEFYHD